MKKVYTKNLDETIIEKSKSKNRTISKYVLDLYPIYSSIDKVIENELTIKQAKKLFEELKLNFYEYITRNRKE